MIRRLRGERGSAVVDFVLILLVLLPLVVGVIQLALVLHVRNTLASAASEGARYAAVLGRSPSDGAERTRTQIDGALAGDFASDITATTTSVGGAPGIEVVVYAEVPLLGWLGPGVSFEVSGHAVQETRP